MCCVYYEVHPKSFLSNFWGALHFSDPLFLHQFTKQRAWYSLFLSLS